jgi:predicted RNA-binding protein with PUA domain
MAKRGKNDFIIEEEFVGNKSFEELCRENKWLFELTLDYANKLLNKGKHNDGDEDKKTTDS